MQIAANVLTHFGYFTFYCFCARGALVNLHVKFSLEFPVLQIVLLQL